MVIQSNQLEPAIVPLKLEQDPEREPELPRPSSSVIVEQISDNKNHSLQYLLTAPKSPQIDSETCQNSYARNQILQNMVMNRERLNPKKLQTITKLILPLYEAELKSEGTQRSGASDVCLKMAPVKPPIDLSTWDVPAVTSLFNFAKPTLGTSEIYESSATKTYDTEPSNNSKLQTLASKVNAKRLGNQQKIWNEADVGDMFECSKFGELRSWDQLCSRSGRESTLQSPTQKDLYPTRAMPMFPSDKIGSLGPDKESDEYLKRASKANKQKMYAEKIRQLAKPKNQSEIKFIADSDAPSPVAGIAQKLKGTHFMPSNPATDEMAQAIAKREKVNI